MNSLLMLNVDCLLLRRVVQDLSVSPAYEAVFWNPPEKYKFKNPRPKKPKAVKVYEAHGEFIIRRSALTSHVNANVDRSLPSQLVYHRQSPRSLHLRSSLPMSCLESKSSVTTLYR